MPSGLPMIGRTGPFRLWHQHRIGPWVRPLRPESVKIGGPQPRPLLASFGDNWGKNAGASPPKLLRLIRLKPHTFPKGQGRGKHGSVFAQPGPQPGVPAGRARPICAWQRGCCCRFGGAARAGAHGGPALATGTRRPGQGAPPASPTWAQGRFWWPCQTLGPTTSQMCGTEKL